MIDSFQTTTQALPVPPNINNNDSNEGSSVTAPDSQSSSPPALPTPGGSTLHILTHRLLVAILLVLYLNQNTIHKAAEQGFLVDNETLFRISYPSNWTKETVPLGRFTAVESTPFVAFIAPSPYKASIVISMNVIGNRLLSDYAEEEINALKYTPSFKLDQSFPSSTTIGNNTAQKIVYTTNEVKNGVIAGTLKSMEIVTIKDGVDIS